MTEKTPPKKVSHPNRLCSACFISRQDIAQKHRVETDSSGAFFGDAFFGVYFCMSLAQTAAHFAATGNWVALFGKGGDQPA